MKKIKRHYKRGAINNGYWGVHYPEIRSSTFKKFSTKQEKSFYFTHKIEYAEYPIKFRVARGKTLADPWDDIASSVYSVSKSWKHNSKRKRQYFR